MALMNCDNLSNPLHSLPISRKISFRKEYFVYGQDS
jgi:hypothetical protein